MAIAAAHETAGNKAESPTRSDSGGARPISNSSFVAQNGKRGMKSKCFYAIFETLIEPRAENPAGKPDAALDTTRNRMKIFAKTYKGLEEILVEELEELGAKQVKKEFRGASFEGDAELLYRVNYCSRLSIKFLVYLFDCEVNSEEQLYQQIRDNYQWHTLFDTEQTFAIDAVIRDSFATHSKFVALKAKDAIADQFVDVKGKRPNVDTEDPNYKIHLHIQNNRCTVYLDSSGQSLHIRGYRKNMGLAPLSEVLAAAMVRFTGWDGQMPLIDPMCGSGTILMEAAMKHMKWPAQFFREQFGCQKWNDFDASLWESMRSKANENKTMELTQWVAGSDKDAVTIRKCTENLIAARLFGDIKLDVKDFFQLEKPEGKCMLITNPPYDARVKLPDVKRFYGRLGSTLKHKWPGTTAWILAADTPAIQEIGLRPKRKIYLMNGPIHVQFLCFELYEGSKKIR